jgi:hypothetical protein
MNLHEGAVSLNDDILLGAKLEDGRLLLVNVWMEENLSLITNN